MTDKERWNDDESYSAGWNPRTILLYDLIEDATTILEFGAGMCYTVGLLKPHQVYTSSDLVNRDEYSAGRETIVMDLNEDPFDIEGPYDAVLMSGVLEYIEDLPTFINHLSGITDIVSCSYSDTTNLKTCEKNGWINHYTQKELRQLFLDAGYDMIYKSVWNDQLLYKFEKVT